MAYFVDTIARWLPNSRHYGYMYYVQSLTACTYMYNLHTCTVYIHYLRVMHVHGYVSTLNITVTVQRYVHVCIMYFLSLALESVL